ncbi:MAG: transposase [Pseudomonadota bacterium]
MPSVPQHIIQRGNNRTVCFYADEDYIRYFDWLKEYAEKTNCQIHAYVLMTNHVHLLASADKPEMIGTLMKALGQRYAQYINRTYKRSAPFGKGATNRAQHKPKPISKLVSAILNLILCVQIWFNIQQIINGTAIELMPKAS